MQLGSTRLQRLGSEVEERKISTEDGCTPANARLGGERAKAAKTVATTMVMAMTTAEHRASKPSQAGLLCTACGAN